MKPIGGPKAVEKTGKERALGNRFAIPTFPQLQQQQA
jgi:hypothetical protein